MGTTKMLDTLRVLEDSTQLDLIWENGTVSRLSAADLRASAKDAASIREMYDNNKIRVDPAIKITAMEMVGSTGINIQFSDGHDRAIYPIPYLKDLCETHDK